MIRNNRKQNRLESGNIDYKDVALLKQFLTDTGKIVPARNTGINIKQQRRLSRAIKQARQMALLAYTDRHAVK